MTTSAPVAVASTRKRALPCRPARLAEAVALSLAASLWSGPSAALSLGEIEIGSNLGQPLRARVPVSTRPGEALGQECVSVVRTDPFGGAPNGLLTSARVELRQIAGKNLLVVSSSEAVVEPVARLLLRVSCGDQGSVYRQYTLLLDPPQYQTAARATRPIALPQAMLPPAPPYTQQVFSGINEYTVKEGDTLDSIVKNRYPNSRQQQRRLRQAITRANSDVLPSATSPLPQAGTPLLIPELPAPLPSAAKARKPKRVAQRAKAAKAPVARGAPTPRPHMEQAIPQAPSSTSAASGSQGEFVLRLSRSTLDTNRPVTEGERAALRERQRLLDADDLTASMLSLQHEMRQMKAEVEALKSQLRQQALPPAAAAGEHAAPAIPPPAPAVKPVIPPRSTQDSTAAHNWFDQWSGLALRWWWLLPVLVLGALLLNMLRRRRAQSWDGEEFDTAMQPPTLARTHTEDTSAPTLAPKTTGQTMAPPPSAAERAESSLQARERDMQARYLTDRFPDLAQSGIDLGDTDAVVEQSRIYFMEDGTADKAIELLEYTTTKHPEHVKPWLALLEIYRQMKMKGAFEKLAIAFRDRFRDLAHWNKVCAIGHALDPNNPLYQQPAAEGSSAAKAVDAPMEASDGEQLRTQNWLDIPLDFTPALRGEELRSELLAELPQDRAEPKGPTKAQAHTVDFDLDADLDKTQQERVEPKLVHKRTQ